MDRHYAMRLLREAVKRPRIMLERKKFWNVDFFNFYLERCDEMLFNEPAEGLLFTKFAPALAEEVSASNPEASRPALLLQAHGYLGGAYRRASDFDRSENSFMEGLRYEELAPGKIIADFYRRLAYLRIFQHRPESFQLITEGIAIHKRGNLVDRHSLGECLLCRAHAYFEFDQPGKSLEDLTAALNHISIQKDDKPYFATLHNLAIWAVDYGTEKELKTARLNLKPAQALLNTTPRRHFAKYKLRWLMAVIDTRLSHFGKAELALLDVRKGLTRLKMPAEVGLLTVDLARLYMDQGRPLRLREMVEETTQIFHALEAEPELQETLGKLREVERVTMDDLNELRVFFVARAQPTAVQLAA